MIAQIKTSKEPWATWAKVKFDIQIVAIAKAESVTVIYADDKDIERYAQRVKIPVLRICDLPLPPEPEMQVEQEILPLGTQQTLNLNSTQGEQSVNKEDKNEPPTTDAGKDKEREATPPHPASVQRIDSGRAESEVAREEQANSKEQAKEKAVIANPKRFPDTSGCTHADVRLETSRVVKNIEFGYCPTCKLEIAFHLDDSGKRTGETEIVEIG